jgi:hypothetical protein
VYRIIFTSADLTNVRVAGNPNPLWETTLSLFRLRRPGPALAFGKWSQAARRAVRRRDLEMLLPLMHRGYFPDFLTPWEGIGGLDAGLEALLATPRAELRRDMARLSAVRPANPSAQMRALYDGDRGALHDVAAALRSHHAAVMAPFGREAETHVEADRALRTRALLEGGLNGLLASLGPLPR